MAQVDPGHSCLPTARGAVAPMRGRTCRFSSGTSPVPYQVNTLNLLVEAVAGWFFQEGDPPLRANFRTRENQRSFQKFSGASKNLQWPPGPPCRVRGLQASKPSRIEVSSFQEPGLHKTPGPPPDLFQLLRTFSVQMKRVVVDQDGPN